MENIKNINSINNIKISVEYDKLEDLELTRALRDVKVAKGDYEYTKSLYEPVIEGMGEEKWNIIREQLTALVKAMKEGNIKIIDAAYRDDNTGNLVRVGLNHDLFYVDEMNRRFACPFNKDDFFFVVGMRGSGFITRWQEYGICNKLRNDLVYRLKKKVEDYQKASNEIKDHFADVRDHN